MKRGSVPAAVIWSPFVVARLSVSRSAWYTAPTSDRPHAWEEAQRHLQYRAVALASVRPVWSADPLRYVSPHQGEVHKYWWHIIGQGVPLVFYETGGSLLSAQP